MVWLLLVFVFVRVVCGLVGLFGGRCVCEACCKMVAKGGGEMLWAGKGGLGEGDVNKQEIGINGLSGLK